jgi:hypothetical protein
MRVALAHVCLSAENASASAAWLTVTAGVDTFEFEYQTKVCRCARNKLYTYYILSPLCLLPSIMSMYCSSFQLEPQEIICHSVGPQCTELEQAALVLAWSTESHLWEAYPWKASVP